MPAGYLLRNSPYGTRARPEWSNARAHSCGKAAAAGPPCTHAKLDYNYPATKSSASITIPSQTFSYALSAPYANARLRLGDVCAAL